MSVGIPDAVKGPCSYKSIVFVASPHAVKGLVLATSLVGMRLEISCVPLVGHVLAIMVWSYLEIS